MYKLIILKVLETVFVFLGLTLSFFDQHAEAALCVSVAVYMAVNRLMEKTNE